MRAKSRGLRAFIVGGVLLAIGAAGCKKDDPAPSAAPSGTPAAVTAKDKTSAPGATAVTSDSAPKSDNKPAPAALTASDALHHVPASCATVAMYVDIQKLFAGDAFATILGKLDQKIAEAMKGDEGEKMEKMVAALKESGLQPAKDFHHFAACLQEGKSAGVVAIDGNFEGKDILGVMSKAAAASGKTLTKKEDAGYSYLVDDKGKAVGMVATNVLVAAENERLLMDARKTTEPSAAWPAAGKVVFMHVVDSKQSTDVSIAQKEGSLEMSVATTMTDAAAVEGMKKNPEAFKTKYSQMLAQAAAEIEKTPIKALAPAIKAMKIDVDPQTSRIMLTATVANAAFAEGMKNLVEMGEEVLEKRATQAHAATLKTAVATCKPGQVRVVGAKPGGVCVPDCAGGGACAAGKACKAFPGIDDDGDRTGNVMACLSAKVGGDDKDDCRVKGCPSGYGCNQVSGFCIMQQSEE